MRLHLLGTFTALATAALQAQGAPGVTLGLAAGFNSSDQQHPIYAVQLTAPLGRRWDIIPSLRGSTTATPQWRASLAVRRIFSLTPAIRAYAGAGPSWTSEATEVQAHGHWGAVAIGGSELALGAASWEGARARLFGEIQLFTHHYASAQWLLGCRLRLS